MSKTLSEIRGNYKVALASWMSRAKNDDTPNNQKSRIMKEIDDEFDAAIRQLVDEAVGDDMKDESLGKEAAHNINIVKSAIRKALKHKGLL